MAYFKLVEQYDVSKVVQPETVLPEVAVRGTEVAEVTVEPHEQHPPTSPYLSSLPPVSGDQRAWWDLPGRRLGGGGLSERTSRVESLSLRFSTRIRSLLTPNFPPKW